MERGGIATAGALGPQDLLSSARAGRAVLWNHGDGRHTASTRPANPVPSRDR